MSEPKNEGYNPLKLAEALRERAPYTHQRTSEALQSLADILDPKGSRESVALAERKKAEKATTKEGE